MSEQEQQAEPEKPNEGDSLVADQASADTLEVPAELEPQEQESEQKDEAPDPWDGYEFTAGEEGQVVDPVVTGTLAEVAKAEGVSPAQAQAILDRVSPVIQQQRAAEVEQLRAGWAETLKTDPEIGGAKAAEAEGFAKRALAKWGSPQLAEMLTTSGLIEEPEFRRLLARVGKATAPDRAVAGTPPSPPRKTRAERMFPDMAQEA